MEYFLISFDYDGWCQGTEKMYETLLVKADSFEQARNKIIDDNRYDRPINFQNKTL